MPPVEVLKKCSLCKIDRILECYYTKGSRWDSRCKDCIKKQKANMRKMRRLSLQKRKTIFNFTIHVREIPASENTAYNHKILRTVLKNLALDSFQLRNDIEFSRH